MDDIRPRCGWCNLSNPVYVAYHDAEWAVPSHDDHHLFEMLVLETFQAGLSWETVYGSFDDYIWRFTGRHVIYETGMTTSPLSDAIAADLKTYGMRFIGTTIVYAYLQSIGVINAHEPGCFLHRER